MLRTVAAAAAATVALMSSHLAAQSTALPPVRPIGATTAQATVPLTLISGVAPVGGGRVLIDERAQLRLSLFDSTLTRATIVMDASDSTRRRYLNPAMGLLPFRGDSVLFVDADVNGFVIIAPDGSIGRTMAYPAAAINPREGIYPFSDHTGNILYQLRAPVDSSALGTPSAQAPGEVRYYLVRANLATRRADTVATLDEASGLLGTTVVVDSAGNRRISQTVNPFLLFDGWTTLADGTIAIVRGRDFHVDWIAADGARTSSPLPRRWVRLTDSAKTAIHDSLTRLYESQGCSGAGAKANADGSRPVVVQRCKVAPAPDQIPDYPPPFGDRAVTADADGNIWIREAPDSTVYDLVNRRGEMFDRRQIPGGTFIVAFEPGAVYLAARNGTSYSLVRAKIR